MITIDNSKVSGFEPVFQKFRGFSCLFDTPGRKYNTKKLVPSNNLGKELNLYKKINQALNFINTDLLTNSYLFCTLPLHSYHLTVFDGINDENLELINPKYKDYFKYFLDNLAYDLQLASPFSEMLATNPLITKKNWNINFNFKKLSIWTESRALVAELTPVDNISQTNLYELEKERKNLCVAFEEEIGIQMYRKYTPHISLGYFANKECAIRAKRELDRWNGIFTKIINGAKINFTSLSLYGFNNMTNFFNTPLNSHMSYSASTLVDLNKIQRLKGMHDLYRTMPDFYGNLLNKETIKKMREGKYIPNLGKIKKHENSYFTSLIIKLSRIEGEQLFNPVSQALKEITDLIIRTYPDVNPEPYLDFSHITIRTILNYKKLSKEQLVRYKDILYPTIKKWVERFSSDTILYAKGLHVSISSFKGLSIGLKIFPSTPFIQILRGEAGITLYQAQEDGILNPEDLEVESFSARWHTKLTHSTLLRVRDSRFLPPWTSNSIPEREKAFIDTFESIVEKYEKVVFGKISNIHLTNIFICNGKTDKLIVTKDEGLEISMKS